MAASNTNPNGWSWVFGKNNKQHSKPIDNPFVNDVEKIATSFYVSNFPNSLDAKNLWKEFQPFGSIVDAFIANKRSKQGKRFGFVRFLGVRNEVDFARSLSNIWIGSYHVYVSVARFQRNHKYASSSQNIKVPEKSQMPRFTTTARPNLNSNNNYEFHKNKSYASVAQGVISTSEVRKKDMLNVKSVQLGECDLIKVEDTSTVVLVKVKEIDAMSNMYHLCRNEGFADVKIHYVGGLWLWLQFTSVKSCSLFKSNDSLKKIWTCIKDVSPSFIVDERMIWIEISGLPLCAWGSSAFKKVANLFGKFKFFDGEAEDIMSTGRVCIATTIQPFISEKVDVTIHGETFQVQVKEIGTWSIHIPNYVESNDSDDEYVSSNGIEVPN